MSSNAYSDERGAAGHAGSAASGPGTQAPRLRAGGYATWRTDMDVFLERYGAEGVHKRKSDAASWEKTVASVTKWNDAALDAALILALADGSGSGSGSSAAESKQPEVDAAVLTARKAITAMVERSRRVYGTVYSALPDELRPQVAHIPQGFAYGLWQWLQDKFQSTEQDSVGELLSQWVALRQDSVCV